MRDESGDEGPDDGSPAVPKLGPVPCLGLTDLFFGEYYFDAQLAAEVCESCWVKNECFEGAVRRGEVHGVWGGMVFTGRGPKDPHATQPGRRLFYEDEPRASTLERRSRRERSVGSVRHELETLPV